MITDVETCKNRVKVIKQEFGNIYYKNENVAFSTQTQRI